MSPPGSPRAAVMPASGNQLGPPSSAAPPPSKRCLLIPIEARTAGASGLTRPTAGAGGPGRMPTEGWPGLRPARAPAGPSASYRGRPALFSGQKNQRRGPNAQSGQALAPGTSTMWERGRPMLQMRKIKSKARNWSTSTQLLEPWSSEAPSGSNGPLLPGMSCQCLSTRGAHKGGDRACLVLDGAWCLEKPANARPVKECPDGWMGGQTPVHVVKQAEERGPLKAKYRLSPGQDSGQE
ncbi:uncharacterized protein LOC125168474 isoform X2 [Prionailurus viverrinus]|uniref:uncharacterized protein LOC125168474 isoform X2 n=1 Tax=Prionailurus viverrinus TaxID=61388 RepID=UPI001FF24D15|nr:uncharacterized protein LOC125168474 isoform X2 [Prionailurus viverrinus]